MAARSPSPQRLNPQGLKILSLKLLYLTHTLPSALTLRTLKTPREPPEILSLTPSAVNGKDLNTGTPKVPQVRIPFSFPPSCSLCLGPAHSGMTQGMRTRLHLFPPAGGKGGGRKLLLPERKHNYQDGRARPVYRNCLIFQRKSCCQMGRECVVRT